MKDKIKGKIDKHYTILVNGQKCKILNYKTEDSRLTIITKISNPNLWLNCDEKGEICIEDGSKRHYFSVKSYSACYGITIFRYYYYILDERIEVKVDGNTQ